MENERFAEIRRKVSENDVVLFMKGSPAFPKDGYSAAVAGVLNSLGAPMDVLEDSELYQAVKEFSNWPSVPQLYVKGEFIGGGDAVKEMHTSGELKKLLQRI